MWMLVMMDGCRWVSPPVPPARRSGACARRTSPSTPKSSAASGSSGCGIAECRVPFFLAIDRRAKENCFKSGPDDTWRPPCAIAAHLGPGRVRGADGDRGRSGLPDAAPPPSRGGRRGVVLLRVPVRTSCPGGSVVQHRTAGRRRATLTGGSTASGALRRSTGELNPHDISTLYCRPPPPENPTLESPRSPRPEVKVQLHSVTFNEFAK